MSEAIFAEHWPIKVLTACVDGGAANEIAYIQYSSTYWKIQSEIAVFFFNARDLKSLVPKSLKWGKLLIRREVY